MKIKRLLSLAVLCIVGMSAWAQSTNYISGWNGGSSTGKPTSYGWSATPSVTWGDLNGGNCRMMTTYSGYKNGSNNYTYNSSDPQTRILLIRYNSNNVFTYTFQGLLPGHAYKFTGMICWVNNDNGNGHQYTTSVKGTNVLGSKVTTIGGTDNDKQKFQNVEFSFVVPEDETATDFTLNFSCNRNGDNIESITNLKLVCDDTKYSADALTNLTDKANSLLSTLSDGDVKTALQTAINGVDNTNIDKSLYNLNKAINAANKATAKATEGTNDTPADWTGVIANPGFEDYELTVKKTSGGNQNNPACWSHSKIWEDGAWMYAVKSADNETEGSSSFKVRFNWANDSYAISQKIAALPKGKYKLTADVKNYNANGSTCKAQISADDTQTDLTTISAATTLELEFVVTEETKDVVIKLNSDYTYKSGSCEGILYWDNVKLYNYGSTSPLEAAKELLRVALTKVPVVPTTNIGTGAFQYPSAEIISIKAAIENAQSVYDNADATLEQVQTATASIENLEIPALNGPTANTRYTITNVTEGYMAKGNAMTYLAGERTDMGNYNIRYYAATNPVYAQAFIFTPVEGEKDTYTLHQIDIDGNNRYLCTGKAYDGGYDEQIRTTTDSEKAAKFVITPMTEEGNWTITNVAANKTVGANNDNGVYTQTSNNRMVIAEAEKAEVTMSINSEVKWATFMAPFAFDIPSGVEVYEVVNVDFDAIIASSVDAIVPNKPYIIHSDSEASETQSGYGLATKDSYEQGELVGTYKAMDAPANSYVLQKHDTRVAFFMVNDVQPKVNPFRAYIKAQSAGVKALSVVFDDEETAIEEIEDGKLKIENSIFDLSGRRVQKAQKGIYIVNGKKIVLK